MGIAKNIAVRDELTLNYSSLKDKIGSRKVRITRFMFSTRKAKKILLFDNSSQYVIEACPACTPSDTLSRSFDILG